MASLGVDQQLRRQPLSCSSVGDVSGHLSGVPKLVLVTSNQEDRTAESLNRDSGAVFAIGMRSPSFLMDGPQIRLAARQQAVGKAHIRHERERFAAK